MKKIIIATDIKFWNHYYGADKRIFSLVSSMVSKKLDLILFFVGSLSEKDKEKIKEISKSIKIIEVHNGFSFRYIFNKILNKLRDKFGFLKNSNLLNYLIKKSEPRLKDFHSNYALKCFREVCAREKPDIVMIEYIKLAYLVDSIESFVSKPILKIIDTIDVMYERTNRFHEKGEPHWINISKEEEKGVLQKFDIILGIQDRDTEKLRELVPSKKVITVGYPSEVKKFEKTDSSKVKLIYIAGAHQANKDAINYFLSTTWRRLNQNYGNKVELKIYGNICNYLLNKEIPPGVSLEGFVKELDSVYKAADIAINPVRVGGGLKIKNVEALCYSLPLVTTSVGAEGLEDGINRSFFVCDTSEEEYATLEKLINSSDLRREMSCRAFEYSKDKFSEEKIYKTLYDVILK